MTAQQSASEWGALSQLDDPSRHEAMRARFEELLTLTDSDRSAAEEEMLLAEEELDNAAHSAMTLSRLRAWTTFNPEQIELLATGVEEARERIPGSAAMRSVAGVQSVIQQLPNADIGLLIEAAPAVRASLPVEMLQALDAQARPGQRASASEVASDGPRPAKRFWQFWRR